jgi:hypothetical protein
MQTNMNAFPALTKKSMLVRTTRHWQHHIWARYSEKNLQEKAAEATKQKEEKRKKPKPDEEQDGMPQHQHCPPAKHHRGDRNPSVFRLL